MPTGTPASPWDFASASAAPAGAGEKLDPNSREALIARRGDYLTEVSDTGANDAEFMVVLVGKNNRQITQFLTALQLPIESRYVPLATFAAAVGISLDDGLDSADAGDADDTGPPPTLAE